MFLISKFRDTLLHFRVFSFSCLLPSFHSSSLLLRIPSSKMPFSALQAISSLNCHHWSFWTLAASSELSGLRLSLSTSPLRMRSSFLSNVLHSCTVFSPLSPPYFPFGVIPRASQADLRCFFPNLFKSKFIV